MPEADCKACRISVRLPDAEVRRILAEYFAGREVALASDTEATRRLEICADCTDLRYGTTCAHCGCLVPVMARIAQKSCPNPTPKW